MSKENKSYIYHKGSLEEEWKKEALKNRKEIERLNNIFDKLEKAILNTYPCMNMYEQDFKSELLNILKDLNGEN